ncbi:MAG: hypothetical protein ACREAT_00750, partial [Nitrosotalea sp.]
MEIPYITRMKTVPIILLSVSVCIIAILMVSSAYAQYGGGPMCCRPSASLSQIVSSGDDVYAIWYNATNLQTNQYDAFLKTSTDGGTSFGNAINITNSLGIKPYDFTVKLGAVAFGDSLYLSWSNWKNGANT